MSRRWQCNDEAWIQLAFIVYHPCSCPTHLTHLNSVVEQTPTSSQGGRELCCRYDLANTQDDTLLTIGGSQTTWTSREAQLVTIGIRRPRTIDRRATFGPREYILLRQLSPSEELPNSRFASWKSNLSANITNRYRNHEWPPTTTNAFYGRRSTFIPCSSANANPSTLASDTSANSFQHSTASSTTLVERKASKS